MIEDSVDSAISELLNLRRDSCMSFPMNDQISNLLLELRFLELYTQCLAKWNEALQDRKNRHLREPKILHVKATLGGATKGLYTTGIKALQTQDFQDWESLYTELLENVREFKSKITQDCFDFLGCSFRYKFSNFELQKFYRCFSDSLNEFMLLKAETIGDLKDQIQRINGRLQLFIQISELNLIMESNNKDVKEFKILIQTWFHRTACLSLLYWIVQENTEEIESKKQIFLSTRRITRMFLSVLKCLWLSMQNRLLMHEGVSQFADFCLEIFQLSFLEDYDETDLRSQLIFLTTFLVDPPPAKDAESIPKQVESLICSLSPDHEMKGAAILQGEMNKVMEEVRELYARIFKDSSSFDFPSTNVLGFVDSILENFKGISDRSLNSEFVIVVQQKLHSLRQCLGPVNELRKENNDMKDFWTRIVNVVYKAKIGIELLLCPNNYVGYDVKCLCDVTDEIKFLKGEIEKIQAVQNFDIKEPVIEMENSLAQPVTEMETNLVQPVTEFVGFEKESKTLIGELVGDSKALKIVTISGMAGQGKTTLARKIYDDPSVQNHFGKRAWCCVSHTYQTKRLLLDILRDIATDSDFSAMAEEDLEERLKSYLSGEKYLIFMDDIWDDSAWKRLRLSFPDQNNGSRIMFTSRIEVEALKTKKDSILHRLRPLTLEESRELLKRKLFGKEDFPQSLEGVSKKIAKDCNGLPLAVVVIAGILRKKVDNLDWWNQIAQSIGSWAINDGCGHILEVSYKHLPESLKPCFLYFGAFQEDSEIRVRKLIQLWISEGFIRKSNKEPEDVAKGYLKDLATRNLIMVAQTSSDGGIKACRIHDLLHKFCLDKSCEENFLQVGAASLGKISSNSTGAEINNYRICIQTGEDNFFAKNPAGPCVHSLLFHPDYSFYMNDWEFFTIGNFKLVHVLDLEEIEFDGYFPEEVVLLVLLRYLAIWCPYGALSVPESIGNLRNLETFRVKRLSGYGNEVSLPNAIWRMKKVRHIDVGGFIITSVSDDDITDPQASSELDNIQTFSAPTLSYGYVSEKLLKRLRRVRKLRCQFDDAWDCHKECNQFPALESLSELESLNVLYVGKLFQPCALSLPSKLTKLTISYFKLPWSEISKIAKGLKKLEVLKLLEDAFDGNTWELENDDFQNLKLLKICNLNIEEWDSDFCDFPFPRLEQLIVEDCYKLQEIPYSFAQFNCNLKRIEIHRYNPKIASSVKLIEEKHESIKVVIQEPVSSSV